MLSYFHSTLYHLLLLLCICSDTSTSGVGGATVSVPSRTYKSEYRSTTTTSQHHRDSSTKGSPPSSSDGKLNSSSNSSFSQSSSPKQSRTSPKTKTTYRTTTTSTSFTSPKDSSTPHHPYTPHTSTRHTTSTTTTSTQAHAPHTVALSSQFKDQSFHNERFTHSSRGVGADEAPERSRSDEFLSRQRGPRTSSYTHKVMTSTTGRSSDVGGDGAGTGTWRHSGSGAHQQQPRGGASAFPSGSTPQRPSPFSLHSLRDFTTLETRLKEALDSPTLQVGSFTSPISSFIAATLYTNSIPNHTKCTTDFYVSEGQR